MNLISHNCLRVLAYHRIANPDESQMLDPRLISATPEQFRHQMQYLSRHYRAVSLQQVLDATSGGRQLPSRAVLITFDDAYLDFLDHAWPILKRWQMPAVIFVPTDYPDAPQRAFWWDRLYRAFQATSQLAVRADGIGDLPMTTLLERARSLRTLQDHLKTIAHSEAMAVVDEICGHLAGKELTEASVLSWDQLGRLQESGIDVCGHTRTHAILTRVSLQQAHEEVAGCMKDITNKLGHALPAFCFPDGAHNQNIVNILRELGVRLAFTMSDGLNDLDRTDLLRLDRTSITMRTSLAIFRLRLLRFVTYLDRWRHGKKRR